MRSLTFAVAAAVVLSSCSEGEVPAEEPANSAVGAPLSEADRSSLDVLFVVDNSGSMASEQLKLASEIQRMMQVLTSGDRYAMREKSVPAGLSDAERLFTPVSSLHVGLVTTNFGGLDPSKLENYVSPVLLSCAGTGDHGALQNELTIATQGVVSASRSEFEGYAVGQTVLPPDPNCALGPQPLYQSFEAGDDASAFAVAFGCTARVGVRGCPFEQPLESMWNALAPSTGKGELFTFINEERGNGDRTNAGFLRPNAALAVVILTDEDDCSITDAGKGLFSLTPQAEAEYGQINLRCGYHSNDRKLQRVLTRYRDGLLGLKPGHADRVVFTTIAGMPLDAPTRSIDSLLSDPVMTFGEQLDAEGRATGMPKSACVSSKGDIAYPARRLLETAQMFPNAVVASICSDDYAAVIDATVNKIAPLMGP